MNEIINTKWDTGTKMNLDQIVIEKMNSTHERWYLENMRQLKEGARLMVAAGEEIEKMPNKKSP